VTDERAREVGIDDRVDGGVDRAAAQVGDRPDLAAPLVRLELAWNIGDLEVDR
jgi:hypothetical protein